jgi:hypothetical protein
MNRLASRVYTALLVSLFASTTAAASGQVLCVYDPLGTTGTAYKFAEDFKLEAKSEYGIDIDLKAHVEEKTASADLAAGKCDGSVITGVAARDFRLKSATVEAIGALPSYGLLRQALKMMADPRLASKMVAGDYETGGIFPAGIVYLYTKDKTWRKSTDLAGRSIAIIANDDAAGTMAKVVGASTVSANTATFGPMFNSGSVDACYAPATAYEPLELHRGISPNGGVIDFPLSQLTLQVVLKKDAWPEGFGQWGRTQSYSQFDKAQQLVSKAESALQAHLVTIPEEDKPGYEKKFQKVRIDLRDRNVYDGFVLKLLKRLRCAENGARSECATDLE